MIALDTNVLVRYIVRDEPRQTAAATRLIESSCSAESPGVISLVALCETVWVLERGYGYRRPQTIDVVRKALSADDLRVEHSELAWQALGYFEKGKADYADYVIGLCGRNEKADATCTFDRRAADCALFRVLNSHPNPHR
ncbi:MAG: type II toxin-antitoxin system VapC family toxin [Candidatus Sumerlaeota bacterium]|nr:type II toxin-antitoxin system VapC family toxin [Candidatus Sumerlaeota bacterium]